MDDNEIHKTGYARYPRFREAFHLLLPSLLLCPQPGILSVSASSYDPNRKQRYSRSVAIKSAPEGSERAGPFVSPLHFLSLETFALGRPRDRPKTRNRSRRWPGGNGSCPRVQTNGTIEWKITTVFRPVVFLESKQIFPFFARFVLYLSNKNRRIRKVEFTKVK